MSAPVRCLQLLILAAAFGMGCGNGGQGREPEVAGPAALDSGWLDDAGQDAGPTIDAGVSQTATAPSAGGHARRLGPVDDEPSAVGKWRLPNVPCSGRGAERRA